MERIASFTVNHDLLTPGLYLSRVDGDVTTWDLRLVTPNTPPYLETPAMHTIEHLGATYLRNSGHKDSIIYFGPMGCRTGFYLLTRELDAPTVIGLVREAFAAAADWSTEVPGTTRIECGNYLEHDLDTARKYAADYCNVLRDWTADMIYYRS